MVTVPADLVAVCGLSGTRMTQPGAQVAALALVPLLGPGERLRSVSLGADDQPLSVLSSRIVRALSKDLADPAVQVTVD
jgi:hypothetical protein